MWTAITASGLEGGHGEHLTLADGRPPHDQLDHAVADGDSRT
jgi:hypothetical protein